MHTINLLIVVLIIFLLIHLIVRVKPEWFIDSKRVDIDKIPDRENEIIRYEDKIAGDALSGPAYAERLTNISGRSSRTSCETQNTSSMDG